MPNVIPLSQILDWENKRHQCNDPHEKEIHVDTCACHFTDRDVSTSVDNGIRWGRHRKHKGAACSNGRRNRQDQGLPCQSDRDGSDDGKEGCRSRSITRQFCQKNDYSKSLETNYT